ncbi:MAG: hypothetical protein AAF662_01370 [Pseudomonadota bacterium]
MRRIPRQIEALVRFRKTEEAGRSGFASTGYRPQFHIANQDWCSQISCPNHERMHPGHSYSVKIAFLSEDLIWDNLQEGSQFLLREGGKVVAEGEIVRVPDCD